MKQIRKYYDSNLLLRVIIFLSYLLRIPAVLPCFQIYDENQAVLFINLRLFGTFNYTMS